MKACTSSLSSHWVTRGDKMQYQSLVLFLPRGSSPERPAMAGFIYDTDYLKNKFFPAALNEVMPDQNQGDSTHPRTAIMVRTEKDDVPLAASASWDGGSAEVERAFQDVFSGLILGIKLRGNTIANISAHLLRTHFLDSRCALVADGRRNVPHCIAAWRVNLRWRS